MEGKVAGAIGAVNGVNRTSRKVNPLLLTLGHTGQTDPFDDAILVAPQFKSGIRWRTVKKVDSTTRPAPLNVEAANTMAGNADQVVFSAAERETNQLNQAFAAAGKVPAETEETLTMLAKSIQSGSDGGAIGPENLVPFKVDVATLPVPGRITTKQYG